MLSASEKLLISSIMSIITDQTDLKNLRIAGKILANILNLADKFTDQSTNLLDLDKFIETEIIKADCQPSFKGFENYPASSCLSLNHEVVHAIPKDYQLKSGDILGIDVGLWFRNVTVDAAITVAVGDISKDQRKLIQATQKALKDAIEIIKPGIRTGDIGNIIQKVAKKYHLGIVRKLSGHGVGYKVHDFPSILNYGKSNRGNLIKENMVLAIEPMFTLGGDEVKTADDGWAVETVDCASAAQFEHTILVKSSGAEIITIL